MCKVSFLILWQQGFAIQLNLFHLLKNPFGLPTWQGQLQIPLTDTAYNFCFQYECEISLLLQCNNISWWSLLIGSRTVFHSAKWKEEIWGERSFGLESNNHIALVNHYCVNRIKLWFIWSYYGRAHCALGAEVEERLASLEGYYDIREEMRRVHWTELQFLLWTSIKSLTSHLCLNIHTPCDNNGAISSLTLTSYWKAMRLSKPKLICSAAFKCMCYTVVDCDEAVLKTHHNQSVKFLYCSL